MRKNLITMLLSTLFVSQSWATSTPEQIKTLFVFNFIKYIEWESKPETYTIGYFGENDELFKSFSEMAQSKSIGNTKIVVKKINQASEALNFHMVYIPESKSALLEQMPEVKNTVIVTEKEGLAKKGSFINFISQEGKIRFEVNKAKFSASNVKISGQLLSLAIRV